MRWTVTLAASLMLACSTGRAEVTFGAAHAIVVDEASGEVLLQKDVLTAAPMASLTKLMTAMVVLDAKLPFDEHISLTDEDLDHLKNTGSRLQIGMALIDPRRFQLRRGKTVEELTARELKLLQLFHSHPDEVLSRERLLNEVWGYRYLGTTRTLDQVIVQLRRKLGDNADAPRHLLTVHGVGYKLVL